MTNDAQVTTEVVNSLEEIFPGHLVEVEEPLMGVKTTRTIYMKHPGLSSSYQIHLILKASSTDTTMRSLSGRITILYGDSGICKSSIGLFKLKCI